MQKIFLMSCLKLIKGEKMSNYIDLTSPKYFWQMRRLERNQKKQSVTKLGPVFFKFILFAASLFAIFYRW